MDSLKYSKARHAQPFYALRPATPKTALRSFKGGPAGVFYPLGHLWFLTVSLTGPRRGGHRGHKMTGPGVSEGSRGAREDQIMCLKGGPGRPNHVLEWGPRKAKPRAPDGPRKVLYGHDLAISQSHPGKMKLSDDSYVLVINPWAPRGFRAPRGP
jgi:hypothetical protein